jgi:hypothetical protein
VREYRLRGLTSGRTGARLLLSPPSCRIWGPLSLSLPHTHTHLSLSSRYGNGRRAKSISHRQKVLRTKARREARPSEHRRALKTTKLVSRGERPMLNYLQHRRFIDFYIRFFCSMAKSPAPRLTSKSRPPTIARVIRKSKSQSSIFLSNLENRRERKGKGTKCLEEIVSVRR